MLRKLIDRLEQNMKSGMTVEKAVNDVADHFGIYKGGKIYIYLVRRAIEMEVV